MTTTHNNPSLQTPREPFQAAFLNMFLDMDQQGSKLLFDTVDAARDGRTAWPDLIDHALSIGIRIEDALDEIGGTELGAFYAENWGIVSALMLDECCREDRSSWDLVEVQLRRRYVGFVVYQAISENLIHTVEGILPLARKTLDIMLSRGFSEPA